jgi:hypothetical protein
MARYRIKHARSRFYIQRQLGFGLWYDVSGYPYITENDAREDIGNMERRNHPVRYIDL